MGYMTDGLTFNTLRGGNTARLPEFHDRHGKKSHTKKDGSDWSDAEWLEAVLGELGEYANLKKKQRRGDLVDVPPEEQKRLLADELADTVIYIDLLAFRLNIDLGEAIMSKFNRTSRKVGSDIMLEADDWHCRPLPESGRDDSDREGF